MAEYNVHLTRLLAMIADHPMLAQMPRFRGGVPFNSGAWAERSGRLNMGGWGELRLHHNSKGKTVSAGLLIYMPLAQGGRTVEGGRTSLAYSDDPSEVLDRVAEEVTRWLDNLGYQE